MENSCFDENTKKLGFGLMRLPKTDGVIDIEETKRMVDMFLNAGFTYFDTAWIYQGSEDAIREALVERYPRDKYTLATKLAAWAKCETREDAIEQFETSLRRTGAGYFDYYLLHNLGGDRTHFFDDFGLWDFLREKKAEGKIKHYGFSFHSSAEELDELLTLHPDVEFVQLQINYADWDNPDVQSREIYETARRHGKPIVVMEPIKGGLLSSPPYPVATIFKDADPFVSYSSWALRFAASLDGVMIVLSGMSNIDQMADNIISMTDFQELDGFEMDTIEEARKAMAAIPLIPCTSCNYCAKECPMEIGISGTFNALNLLRLYGNRERALRREAFQVTEAGRKRADECIKCGMCESVCPQHIEIRKYLEEAVDSLIK